MAKIAVINYSRAYNLGARKIEKCHQDHHDEVVYSVRANMMSLQCQKAYLSAIFTYDLPDLCKDAVRLKSAGLGVEVGGPASTVMPDYVEKQCGIKPHIGLDDRFESVKGNFAMSFTSRSCRNHCPWCIVPEIEPEAREYDDFPIPVGKNPYLGDNNILSTSLAHQQLVVERLKGVRNLDINSGFESPLFTEDSYKLYSKLDLECYRLAFDSMDKEQAFTRAVKILRKHAVDYRRIIVYVLIGFPGSTYEDAVYRLEKVRGLGCSPYPQRFQPLYSVDSRKYVAAEFDAEELGKLRQYWINASVWRSCTFKEFQLKYKSTNSGRLVKDSLNRHVTAVQLT